MIATFFAAALAQAALGATPSADHPAAPHAAAAPAPGADKVVCKTLPATGSLFGGPKECHTKAEWDAEARANRDTVQDYQQRSGRTH